MLQIECPEHLEEVRKFADSVGLREDLEGQLKCLGKYACDEDPENTRCLLHKDFAPHSFGFTMRIRKGDRYEHWFIGGLIYGGPEQPLDGSAPAFTCSFDSTRRGWFVHT